MTRHHSTHIRIFSDPQNIFLTFSDVTIVEEQCRQCSSAIKGSQSIGVCGMAGCSNEYLNPSLQKVYITFSIFLSSCIKWRTLSYMHVSFLFGGRRHPCTQQNALEQTQGVPKNVSSTENVTVHQEHYRGFEMRSLYQDSH